MKHTKTALAEYDKGANERERLFIAIIDAKSLDAWETRVKEDRRKVQEAFYANTKDFNSHDNCLLVTESFVRNYVGASHEKALDQN